MRGVSAQIATGAIMASKGAARGGLRARTSGEDLGCCRRHIMSLGAGARRCARISIFVAVLGLLTAGCGINNIPTDQEDAKAKWSQVLNQYQRRADLIPNLVE